VHVTATGFPANALTPTTCPDFGLHVTLPHSNL
jgi:hypothetical protein